MKLTSLIDAAAAWPRAAILLLLACVFSLSVGLVTQYGFGLQPCILCLWQRVPYVLVAILMIIGFIGQRRPVLTQAVLLLATIAFLAGAATASFHTGVERHWWGGLTGCAVGSGEQQAGDAASLRDRLLATPVARCDQIPWSFLGLSMANYNVPYSLGLALWSGLAFIRLRRKWGGKS